MWITLTQDCGCKRWVARHLGPPWGPDEGDTEQFPVHFWIWKRRGAIKELVFQSCLAIRCSKSHSDSSSCSYMCAMCSAHFIPLLYDGRNNRQPTEDYKSLYPKCNSFLSPASSYLFSSNNYSLQTTLKQIPPALTLQSEEKFRHRKHSLEL
jgi:hypothetical protein